MAYITTSNISLKMPVPGTREPAQIALLNENSVALSEHDHTTGKCLAVGRLRSGLEANRPAAGSAGNVYFATDTGKFYADSGTVWVEFITTGGTSTITGWTLVDPIIRDTLNFGPEPTGTPDATLSRTGAGAMRVDAHLGVGVAPAAWSYVALQVGRAALQGHATDGYFGEFSTNTRQATTAGEYRSLDGAAGSARWRLQNGAAILLTAPTVAQDAVQNFTVRATFAQTGTLTLTPDAGATALTGAGLLATTGASGGVVFGNRAGVGDFYIYNSSQVLTVLQSGVGTRATIGTTGTLTLTPDAGVSAIIAQPSAGQPALLTSGELRLMSGPPANILLQPSGGYVVPAADNTVNLGSGGLRFGTVYAVAGAINTSSAAVKEGITPLDPAACYQAAKEVRWYDFRYAPPVYTEPEPPPDIAYDASDDNETKAEKKAARDESEAQAKAAHLKMVAETAPARHQRGFVFPAGPETKDEAGGTLPTVPDLFGLSDRESTTPQADIATLGAAMQEIIRRLELLEAASGQAPAA